MISGSSYMILKMLYHKLTYFMCSFQCSQCHHCSVKFDFMKRRVSYHQVVSGEVVDCQSFLSSRWPSRQISFFLFFLGHSRSIIVDVVVQSSVTTAATKLWLYLVCALWIQSACARPVPISRTRRMSFISSI